MKEDIMKFEKLIGERFKEKPADAIIQSHALMMRGGYMKQITSGIFSQTPVLRRITHKIEQIIREEMDAIDGQETLFPVVMPATLWQESGRYDSIGNELIRFKDRYDSPMVLGMTHEEAAVHLVREYGQTYTKYPFMIYQIQTKFRDEARPRGGLIRVREFTMKDAYSFHTSQEDLETYYDKCYQAYKRIFERAGLPETIAVASDSGMMGGKIAHEFMLLTPVGEDSIVICSDCDYSANLEAAKSIISNESTNAIEPLQKVHTPNAKTIDDVCNYLNLPTIQSCKAVVYQKVETGEYAVVFIRGDLDANEVKIRNHLKCEIHPAIIDDNSELCAGFLGPSNFENVTMLFDESLKGISNLCCGANKVDYHFTGFNIERDYGKVDYYDFAKVIENGICPQCSNASLEISRGIEVGNIFQLGDKYTRAMGMSYTDNNGDTMYPVMGCYGIGVERLAASVCEVRHDEFGPIWPMSIAPWQVHLCCVRADDEEAKAFADELYKQLQEARIEVIYDDRAVRAGVIFSDADLLGVPIRIIVSPRNMANNCCEITTRNKAIRTESNSSDVIANVQKMIVELMG